MSLPCKHKRWARALCAPRPLGEPLVIGRPPDSCPWCAQDAGRRLADSVFVTLPRADVERVYWVLTHLLTDFRALGDREVKAAAKAIALLDAALAKNGGGR
jgi:hypothetical protein